MRPIFGMGRIGTFILFAFVSPVLIYFLYSLGLGQSTAEKRVPNPFEFLTTGTSFVWLECTDRDFAKSCYSKKDNQEAWSAYLSTCGGCSHDRIASAKDGPAYLPIKVHDHDRSKMAGLEFCSHEGLLPENSAKYAAISLFAHMGDDGRIEAANQDIEVWKETESDRLVIVGKHGRAIVCDAEMNMDVGSFLQSLTETKNQ